MKLFIMATIAALAMGSLFHEDIARTLTAKGDGARPSIPAVQSAGNLGEAMSDRMQGIGSSLER